MAVAHPVMERFVFRNGVVAKNRTAVAAMTNTSSNADGTITDAEHNFLVRRAAGDFGIVTTCASHVSRDGQAWEGELACYSDDHLPGLAKLADGIREHGALGMVQLFHGGSAASPELVGSLPWSPAAVGRNGRPLEDVREATPEDITRSLDDFVNAAVRCEKAGFAGVELHGAHGYLICQFLSNHNTRRDEWGGPTLESRARFLRTIMQRIRARVAPGFLVGVRLSPEDGSYSRGIDLDEAVQTAVWACDDGADFIHISLWDYRPKTRKYSDRHALEMFREAIPRDVPILAAGHIWTREDAETTMALGADFVAVARAAIANYDWPRRLYGAKGMEVQRTPVPLAHLRDSAVGEAFIKYLWGFGDFIDLDDVDESRKAKTTTRVTGNSGSPSQRSGEGKKGSSCTVS